MFHIWHSVVRCQIYPDGYWILHLLHHDLLDESYHDHHVPAHKHVNTDSTADITVCTYPLPSTFAHRLRVLLSLVAWLVLGAVLRFGLKKFRIVPASVGVRRISHGN